MSLDINGIHPQYLKDGTKRLLIVVNKGGDASELKYQNGVTWTLVTSGNVFPSEGRIEMRTFINHVFIVGATVADSPTWATTASLAGTTYSTSTNVTDAPKARYIEVYKDLVYLANIQISSTNYPSRVFYSDDVVSSAITWTSTNWFDINEDDGDKIMGLGLNSDRLLIFKEWSLYRFDTNTVIKVSDVGTTTSRSIKNIDIYTFFFNRSGVYKYAGGRPIRISEPVQDLIDGMTSSPYDVVGSVDREHYRLFIGDTTDEDGETHTNLEL